MGSFPERRGFHRWGLVQSEFLGISASERAWPPCLVLPSACKRLLSLPGLRPASPGHPWDRPSRPYGVCIPRSPTALSSWRLRRADKRQVRGLRGLRPLRRRFCSSISFGLEVNASPRRPRRVGLKQSSRNSRFHHGWALLVWLGCSLAAG